ncbi:uncharacterized protein A4U43_C03F21800 [Asparagus officinalis]|uniref:RRM domain-containing protein n=1 Tax=Asparagus officinalis TaxID=4686 RepID=A0A5P1FC07_ASPOF|nr:uncharacterized protein LOC109834185 [Asparagus officinalis]ONK75905.1 uncharacterized protein A4U43_C03F21800 [Asparagus officinalis]
MASADQPLKKRKLYDPSPEPPPPPPLQSFFSPPPPPPPTPPPLSQDEILRRQSNRKEIRNLYECYRSIRFCVEKKDARFMPDLEKAYLSLITASRGCTSVQRIVAELIPRYASFCPTALEAAVKVSINMYNWSFAIIMRGEDVDTVAYQTAKACIFGLVEICCTASHEAPTSSVISGICSAVFENVLTFFTSTFEGNDIYQIGYSELQKLQEPIEFFCDLKQEPADKNEPPLHKLFKFRALSLLRIFLTSPQNLLSACFELLVASGTDTVHRNGGQYFLSQLTSQLNETEVTHSSNRISDATPLCTDSAQCDTEHRGSEEANPVSNDNNNLEKPLLLSKNCFIEMALHREPSLRNWLLWRYRKFCKSFSSEDISEITSFLEKIFGSLSDAVKEAGLEDNNGDNLGSSKYIGVTYEDYNRPSQHSDNAEASDGEQSLGVHNVAAAGTGAGQNLKPHKTWLSNKGDSQSHIGGLAHEGESSTSMSNLETGNSADLCPNELSPKGMTNRQFIPSVIRRQADFKNDDSDTRIHAIEVEKVHNSNIDRGLPAKVSASGGSPNVFPSPRQHLFSQHQISYSHNFWCCDGDPSAMDVFTASKQLWVGSLGRDASETLVQLQFEDFGPLMQFISVPVKGFALIEYRNIMDAVKAREYMHGSAPWGGSLRIKFVDRGVGSRGISDHVAVGDSCHVYVGKVSTQWEKDQILHELMMAGIRKPHITDLVSESALLLEFRSAEEAASAVAHIRYLRRGTWHHTCPDRVDNSGAANHMVFSPPAVSIHNSSTSSSMAQNTNASGYFPSREIIYPAGMDIKPPNPYSSSFTYKPEGSTHELVSPRLKMEKHATQAHSGHQFQSNWAMTSRTEMLEVGSGKVNDSGRNTTMDHSFAGPVNPHAAELVWQYNKQEVEPQMSTQVIQPSPPTIGPSGSMMPPPIQSTSFVRPVYFNPTNSWETSVHNPSISNQISSGMIHTDNHHFNSRPAVPFIPSSVTPVSQLHGCSMQQTDQMVTVPCLSSLMPPPPDVPPPLPSSPPPLPPPQPPSVPPPPSSPPQSVPEPSTLHLGEPRVHQWQGALTKSGVHYCAIYATREDSAICRYSNAASEPANWPASLDVTKRTDIRHVKTTFSSTRPHRREVCRLLPSSTSELKGFHDFISYLKQRDCAGVIKVTAGRSLWARLLFILPNSADTCSLLGISPHPADCLIALVLPKDTNTDGA